MDFKIMTLAVRAWNKKKHKSDNDDLGKAYRAGYYTGYKDAIASLNKEDDGYDKENPFKKKED